MRSWFRLYLTAGLAIVVLGVALTTVSVTGRHDTEVVASKRVPVSAAPSSSPSPTSSTSADGVPSSPAAAATSAGGGAGTPNLAAAATGPVAVATSGEADAPGPPAGPATTQDILTPSTAVALTCPLPLAGSTIPGGLASLTTLLPLFGPFSAEAFAAVPLFQPFFPLAAPVFNLVQRLLTPLPSLIDNAVPIVQLMENAGYQTLLPAYAPFRTGFLDFVKNFANSLQPLVEQVVALPGTGCLPALQGALLSIAAKP